MNEKKVVAVIVEGPSDKNAIGGIFLEFCTLRTVSRGRLQMSEISSKT